MNTASDNGCAINEGINFAGPVIKKMCTRQRKILARYWIFFRQLFRRGFTCTCRILPTFTRVHVNCTVKLAASVKRRFLAYFYQSRRCECRRIRSCSRNNLVIPREHIFGDNVAFFTSCSLQFTLLAVTQLHWDPHPERQSLIWYQKRLFPMKCLDMIIFLMTYHH